jgi:serine/threonine protein kinase
LVLALGYVHERGVVFRDLKPENVLMAKSGYLALTDFGVAKSSLPSLAFSLVGTPDYMAPEMIASLGHNQMIDWWALGVLVFEMVTGITPFYSDN